MGDKFTKGPWRWWPCKGEGCDGKKDYVQLAAGPQFVAQVRIQSITDEDMRLIAAAPCLLEALRELVTAFVATDEEGLVEHAEPMQRARAAIAKALGEPS